MGAVGEGSWADSAALRPVRATLARLAPWLGWLCLATALGLVLLNYSDLIQAFLQRGPDGVASFAVYRSLNTLGGPWQVPLLTLAPVLALVGIGLLRRRNWIRWVGGGAIVVAALMLVMGQMLMRFGDVPGVSPGFLLLPLAALPLLLMGPVAPPPGPPRRLPVDWPARVAGTVLLYYGIMVGLIFIWGGHFIYGLRAFAEPRFLASYVNIDVLPVAFALGLIAAGIGITLRRRWASPLAGFIGVFGVSFVLMDWIRGWNSVALPVHLAVIAIVGIALLLRRPQPVPPAPGPMPARPQGYPTIVPPADGNWTAMLLAALHDDAYRPPRPHVRLATIGFLAVFVIYLLPATILRHSTFPTLELAIYLPIGWTALGLLVANPLARYFGRQIAASRSRTAEQQLAAAGGRPPVLYLRSFALDEAVARPTWWEIFLGGRGIASAEAILVSQLQRLGPIVAIGRPGEKMTSLGAARFYATDATWQDKVALCAAASQLVVWTTGTSPGLAWEADYLVARVPHHKVAVWAHPHLLRVGQREREAEWTVFRDTLGTRFPKPFPERLGRTRFFLLAPDGTPVPVASQHWSLSILIRTVFRGSLEAARQRQAVLAIVRLRGQTAVDAPLPAPAAATA
ncbi:MAG TPA: hypothetical protein VHZ56_06900 [Devosia sp.]|nr:hypothetical protein [Devosia sp.]